MRFTQSLEKKYKLSENENSDFKKPPVASSLTAFLKCISASTQNSQPGSSISWRKSESTKTNCIRLAPKISRGGISCGSESSKSKRNTIKIATSS